MYCLSQGTYANVCRASLVSFGSGAGSRDLNSSSLDIYSRCCVHVNRMSLCPGLVRNSGCGEQVWSFDATVQAHGAPRWCSDRVQPHCGACSLRVAVACKSARIGMRACYMTALHPGWDI